MSNTLIHGKTVDDQRFPVAISEDGELLNRLTQDASAGGNYSMLFTLAAATVFRVIAPDSAKGFYIVTALTDVRFAVDENPVAINSPAVTVSPADVTDMVVGNSMNTLDSRLLADGVNREVRFLSAAGGDVTINFFG